MDFKQLGLSPEVMDGIDKHGFTSMTDVQEKVIPSALKGKDVMVQSKTGSGKTLVFLSAIFEKHVKDNNSRAIVIAPTRELADQIEKDAISFATGLKDYTIGCFYGGVGYEKQSADLKNGVNLVVGTPGRLLDFSKSGKLDFASFDTVVLDEADRMFDMGFYPDIQEMFKKMKRNEERQTMLFSATLSVKVRNLAWAYMDEPEEFDVQPEEITVKNITQELFHVTKEEKFGLLLSIFSKLQPKSCIIFTNTKDRAVEVSERLNMNGYKTSYLMGDMAQNVRLKTLDNLKNGKISTLVATDVAARGLQVDDLELVVNYDIPEDYENYVHRIGRTARAGKTGKAITLACEEYIYGLEAIENYIQMKVPVLWADEVGLEPVEDKSEGYRPRRRNYNSNGHSSNGGRRPQNGDRRRSSTNVRRDNRSDNRSSKPQGERKPRQGQSEQKQNSQNRNRSNNNNNNGKNYSKNQNRNNQKRQNNNYRKPQPQKTELQKEIAGKNVTKVNLSTVAAPEKKTIWQKIKSFFKNDK